MTEEQRKLVIDSPVKFVERVAVGACHATHAETEILPAVAGLLLGVKTIYSPMNLR